MTLEETKRLRLCPCGHYKKASTVVCADCFRGLEPGLADALTERGFNIPWDDPLAVEARRQVATNLEEIETIKAQGYTLPPDCSNAARFCILRRLANHGVRLTDEDWRWFASQKELGRRLHAGVNHQRNRIRNTLAEVSVSGGFGTHR